MLSRMPWGRRKQTLDKGKLAARRGRKATGLTELAGLPKVTDARGM
jgi:hypothetical protein